MGGEGGQFFWLENIKILYCSCIYLVQYMTVLHTDNANYGQEGSNHNAGTLIESKEEKGGLEATCQGRERRVQLIFLLRKN